ncbi:ribonuclease Z [Candidatus Woesearchaeota archaeon]|nr:ribonuclease Z [Candidatus Woesearchaeota archaeon]
MKIVFLGTGSMQPTKERNLSCIYINYDSEHILFDCGEGTQRQLKIAGLKAPKITRILISHYHGDHILGLGGILKTLEANDYNKTLYIYGPKGLENFYNNIINSAYKGKGIKTKLIELKEGIIIDEKNFQIEAKKLEHSVPCYGFSLIEKEKIKINLDYLKKFNLKQHPLIGELQKGKDITYEGKKISHKKATYKIKGKKLTIIYDTAYCNQAIALAKDSDLLISEATFSKQEKDKAKEYKHLTSEEAATIAKKAKAKRLILTHFSQRYKDVSILKKEAKKIFSKTETAEDFLEVNF